MKKEHYLIAVPITHEELASAVNSTRPTITKLLTKMIDKSQVVYQQNGKNRWIILKPLFFPAAEPF
ncbi:helix-turn-helix domain-containing protein [Bacillus licheniformis]